MIAFNVSNKYMFDFEVSVFIYKTHKNMRTYGPRKYGCVAGETDWFSKGTIAQYHRCTCHTPPVALFFNEEDITPGVIAHEVTHFALRLGLKNVGRNRFKVNIHNRDKEENICELIEGMTNAIWNEYQRRKDD